MHNCERLSSKCDDHDPCRHKVANCDLCRQNECVYLVNNFTECSNKKRSDEECTDYLYLHVLLVERVNNYRRCTFKCDEWITIFLHCFLCILSTMCMNTLLIIHIFLNCRLCVCMSRPYASTMYSWFGASYKDWYMFKKQTVSAQKESSLLSLYYY